MNKLIGLLAVIILLTSCSDIKEKGSEEYISSVNAWHKHRIENLKKETGWLNLAGLYWLKEGENTFGSNSGNDIVFPKNKSAEFIGVIEKRDSSIIISINKDVSVKLNGELVSKVVMVDDTQNGTTVLSHRSLKWFVIKRAGNRYGIRLRDLEADLLKSFAGVDRFPVNEDWNIKAKFVQYNPPKAISIPTVLGNIEKDFAPGKLVFNISGEDYFLDPVKSGNGFFLIFADKTSGEDTYGAGRFLYVEAPDSNNNVQIDFNLAYNPPCAFTPYATCPLPPEQNYLKLSVNAGEKKYGDH